MSNTQNDTIAIANALFDLETVLRQQRLWDSAVPPPQAMMSEQPFCVDTLTLSQWLQFIFLPRMQLLIEHEQALPSDCGIAPMAEEYFRGDAVPRDELIAVLARIDSLLNDAASA